MTAGLPTQRRVRLCAALLSAIIISACGGGGSGKDASSAAADSRPTNPPGNSGSNSGGGSGGSGRGKNKPPTISGTPATSVEIGQVYAFVPQASDPDGDPLTFSITNVPPWASFDAATGALTGTPAPDQTGSWSGIEIAVSDGRKTAKLDPFGIAVTAPEAVLGSATLSWVPPLLRTDGTPLDNLAGFRVHYGPDPSASAETITVDNPGLATFVVEQLPPGTWYFAVSAYDATGGESEKTDAISKTIL